MGVSVYFWYYGYFLKFQILVFGYGFGFLIKKLDFQKYNSDNQIKFQIFFMSPDRILDKNYHIF